MRHQLSTLAVAFGLFFAPLAAPEIRAAAQEGAVANYAVILSIASGDTRAQVRTLAQELAGKISGRSPISPQEPTEFTRFIIADTNPEIGVVFVVGVNGDVNAVTRSELERLPPVGAQFLHFSDVLTREDMEARLIQFAGQSTRTTKYWVARPGVSAAGFILANFVPYVSQ
jgi:hypothetical protein